MWKPGRPGRAWSPLVATGRHKRPWSRGMFPALSAPLIAVEARPTPTDRSFHPAKPIFRDGPLVAPEPDPCLDQV